MNEGVTITNQELSILCDIVGGRNKKWDANLTPDKRLALDHLIANGFVAPNPYRPTDKTELLFAQLCTGVSGE